MTRAFAGRYDAEEPRRDAGLFVRILARVFFPRAQHGPAPRAATRAALWHHRRADSPTLRRFRKGNTHLGRLRTSAATPPTSPQAPSSLRSPGWPRRGGRPKVRASVVERRRLHNHGFVADEPEAAARRGRPARRLSRLRPGRRDPRDPSSPRPASLPISPRELPAEDLAMRTRSLLLHRMVSFGGEALAVASLRRACVRSEPPGARRSRRAGWADRAVRDHAPRSGAELCRHAALPRAPVVALSLSRIPWWIRAAVSARCGQQRSLDARGTGHREGRVRGARGGGVSGAGLRRRGEGGGKEAWAWQLR